MSADKTEAIGVQWEGMDMDGRRMNPMNLQEPPAQYQQAEKSENKSNLLFQGLFMVLLVVLIILGILTIVRLDQIDTTTTRLETMQGVVEEVVKEVAMSKEAGAWATSLGANVCIDKKPKHASPGDYYFDNIQCVKDNVVQALEQAGADVTEGNQGELNATGRDPIMEPYWKAGLCPVNVHWHFGAEHKSVGQYDETGSGPVSAAPASHRHLLASKDTVREGLQCHYFDDSNSAFTKEYHWNHCKDMQVGKTYEVHWPHSAAGACGTPNQYQTPFYDGVFCNDGIISLDPLNTFEKIGVQAQVFTVINDEKYYYPDLIRGMIVDGEAGANIAKYTGSTTGTSRSNEVCSRYTPITWQVDRECHLISASSFDKMCADMKAQRDDMTDDLHPHGAREIVASYLTANNIV